MKLYQEFLDGKARYAAITAGILLIIYIGFLVGMNYMSQVRLQKFALDQFKLDMEKRTTAIGYFFYERKNDLKDLTESRVVSAYFENKALGMSMEYGLRASLLNISKEFDRLLAARKLDNNNIFDRIILINSSGKLLVDSHVEGVKQIHEKSWKKFLTPKNPDVTIIVSHDKQSLRLMASIPYYFKKKHVAQIVAWISPKSICRLMQATGESSGRPVYIVSKKELFPIHGEPSYETALTSLSNLDALEIGKTYRFDTVNTNGTRMDILAARIPVKNTSLSLVFLLPASEVFGFMAPWYLPLAMVLLAIVVLGGMAAAFKINAQKLILQTRLQESSKREEEVQQKNRQLKQEVTERERAEEALRKAQEELEIKIKERTRELAESNLLLKREIKERMHAEEIIRESEARYRSVFENTGTATLIVEEDATLSMINTEFEKLSGCSKEEVEGRMSWMEFVAREDLEKMKAYYDKRRKENGDKPPDEYEFSFIDKQGNVKHVLNKVTIIPETAQTIASLLDITSRKRGEEKLEREKEKFRVLVEKSPLGISIVQEDGRYKYINPKFVEIFGYTIEDIPTGRDWFLKAYPDEELRKLAVSTWISDLNKLKQGEVRRRMFTATCKDGSQKVIDFRAVTIGSGDQIITYEDITEKRRLEAQLQHARKMEAVGTLTGGIAHDFNNFLQVIFGYTELLLTQNHMAPVDIDNLKGIKNSTMKASELTKRLLIFSRKVESNPRPMDLNQAVQEVCKLLERTIPRMIDIQFQPAKSLKIINGDHVLIEQIIMNLGINSRDAMPEGGRLVFKTENVVMDKEYAKTHLGVVPGEYVLLSISDTGHGMDKEIMEHIFEPFFTTKGIGEGTGLGLAMVYGIVKDHEGHIICYSKPGEGTTFKIYFPAIQSEDTEAEEDKKTEDIQGGKETILLVDDEKSILDIGKKMLTRFGYEIIMAQSGEEAIEIIRKMDPCPEVVILDLNMPGMGGNKCLEILLEMNPGIKVIVASGYSADGRVKDTLGSGASGFIEKPYQLESILKKIREVLDDG